MKNIAEVLEGVKTVGIGGHIRPDGDCVGSVWLCICISESIFRILM